MIGKTRHVPRKYARICADMQRFGNFGAEVPEIVEAGLIPLKSRSPAQAARIICERRAPIGSAEIGEHRRLDLLRNLSRRLAPSNEEVLRSSQLPDQPTTPVSDRLAGTELSELAQAPPQVVPLSDVDDLRAVDPVRMKGRGICGRVAVLEPPTRIGFEEVGLGAWRLEDDVDATRLRNLSEVVHQGLKRDPSNEASGSETLAGPSDASGLSHFSNAAQLQGFKADWIVCLRHELGELANQPAAACLARNPPGATRMPHLEVA